MIMKLIELHFRGSPRAFNVANINVVAPIVIPEGERTPGTGRSKVWMVGDQEEWTVDESYDDILRMIPED